MRNATTDPGDFLGWAANEAERSALFRARIDWLRNLANGPDRAGYPRTTGPLTTQSWDRLGELLADNAVSDQAQRKYAWKDTELPTADGLRHVCAYRRGCRQAARGFIGNGDVAPLIHQLVAATGYRLSGLPAGGAAPTGGVASTLAAHISGASWGTGATAQRQAWRRARPNQHETFVL